MRKLLISAACAAGAMFASSSAMAAGHSACGAVEMAEMNWPSASLMANVDAFILENGYGCDVSIIPGDTLPTFTSMNTKGRPDIAGELWINAVREPLFTAFDAGTLHSAIEGPITELGEGWWIPPHTAEAHPELKTVLDILERPDLFPDAEDPSKGAFYGCPAGWGCQLANANLFRAFDMEAKGWKLIDPGSAAGLDGSMKRANVQKENWFGYYWSPTALIGQYSMVPVPFGIEFAGSENWDGCIAKAVDECVDPKPSAWTKSEVHTVITDRFKKEGGVAVDYLAKRVFPGPIMNGMLVFMTTEQATGEDAAIEFIEKHADLWKTWVSEEAAAKIEAAL